MDRRQKKEKKREERIKKQKLRAEQQKHGGLSENEKRSGWLQLSIFFILALSGALFIIFNV